MGRISIYSILIILLLIFTTFSTIDLFLGTPSEELLEEGYVSNNENISKQILNNGINLNDSVTDVQNDGIEDSISSDQDLLIKWGLPNRNSTISNPITLSSETNLQIGNTTYEFNYFENMIFDVQTYTPFTNVDDKYIVVANITTSTGVTIVQSLDDLDYGYVYFEFGGAQIHRFNYTGEYRISIAVYLPILGSPEYELINSTTQILGGWNASDFISPFAEISTVGLIAKDSDASGKFDQFLLEGQIQILDFSGPISIISIIYSSDLSGYTYNQTVVSVSPYETLNIEFTMWDTLLYSLEEAENLYWMIAFGDYYDYAEIYYDRIFVDPQQFDPLKFSFTMNHEIADTDSNSFYDVIRGTYELTATEENIAYDFNIGIESETSNLGYGRIYGGTTIGSEIQILDIEITDLGFLELIGMATISVYVHVDLPVVINGQITYNHFHISKEDTIFLNYTEFEPSPITMTVGFRGNDIDGDELFNQFLLDFDFDIIPGYGSISVYTTLYLKDPNYGERYLESKYIEYYIDETWTGKFNLTFFSNEFFLWGSTNSSVRARISVTANPFDPLVDYFNGERNIEQNFNISQFDPPPINIIGITDYLLDTNGNGKAEEMVINIELNITDTLTNPYLRFEFRNGTYWYEYYYLPVNATTYNVTLHFSNLDLLRNSDYMNGSFEYEIRIYDDGFGGIIRELFGVTNYYSRDQFEELPVKIVPDSLNVEFLDTNSANGERLGYDLVKFTFQLNITVESSYYIDSYVYVHNDDNSIRLDGQYEYAYYTESGILEVTFEYTGWEFYRTFYDGNMIFDLNVRTYVNGSTFYYDKTETVTISYLDFDPPNVQIDFGRSLETSKIDADNNGLADYLQIMIPLIILEDMYINYQVYLRDSYGSSLGSVSESIELFVNSPQDIFVFFPSAEIFDRASAGEFTIDIYIRDYYTGKTIDDTEIEIGTFDPIEFDTWPIYFPDDLELNIEENYLDLDSDSLTDWLVFTFTVEVRIQDNYRILGYINLFNDNAFVGVSESLFPIFHTMQGSVSVSIMVSGQRISALEANRLELSWVKILQEDGNVVETNYVYKEVNFDSTTFDNNFDVISTTLSVDDFIQYRFIYYSNPDVNIEYLYMVTGIEDSELYLDKYIDENLIYSHTVNITNRLVYISGDMLRIQIDPDAITIGSWFEMGEHPTQIIDSTVMIMAGNIIEVWIATDGVEFFYIDKATGVLVQYIRNLGFQEIIDTNFDLGVIPVTTTEIIPEPITPSTPVNKKKTKTLDLNAPHFMVVFFALIFTGVIRRKRKLLK